MHVSARDRFRNWRRPRHWNQGQNMVQREAVFINGPVMYWTGFKMAALRGLPGYCALLWNHKFLTHTITVFNIQNNASYALMPTTNTETTSEGIFFAKSKWQQWVNTLFMYMLVTCASIFQPSVLHSCMKLIYRIFFLFHTTQWSGKTWNPRFSLWHWSALSTTGKNRLTHSTYTNLCIKFEGEKKKSLKSLTFQQKRQGKNSSHY